MDGKNTYRMKGPTFSIFVPLATNGGLKQQGCTNVEVRIGNVLCRLARTYRMKGPTFSIFVPLATRSGKSFTDGFGIGWKIRLTHPSKAKGAVPFSEG
jgi:hypothetical protein